MKINCLNLNKEYENIKALDSINLNLEIGLNLLIGRNGAGKSTLLNVLSTVVKPTSGKVEYNQKNIFCKEYKKRLGYLPQDFGIYNNLTGYEFLMYMAMIKGLDKKNAMKIIKEYLGIFNLSNNSNKALNTYSGGMKQRVGIIQSLLNSPDVLILDEPFNGLDPFERKTFKEILNSLATNKIIILSSHVLSELEELNGYTILIEKGKIISTIHIKDLVKESGKISLEEYYFKNVEKEINK